MNSAIRYHGTGYWVRLSRNTITYYARMHRWRALARAAWLTLVRGYYLELCQHCGRRVELVWHSPDDLYRRATHAGCGGLFCMTCFDGLAEAVSPGEHIIWVPVPSSLAVTAEHQWSETYFPAQTATRFCRSCGNAHCLPDPFDCAMARIASMSTELDEYVGALSAALAAKEAAEAESERLREQAALADARALIADRSSLRFIRERDALAARAECAEAAAAAPEMDRATVADGFGSEWAKCARADCGLQVVRPGKVQCDCDGEVAAVAPSEPQETE